jgi:AmmeMemoRadiSam system protein A
MKLVMKLEPTQRRELLALARASIESALPNGNMVPYVHKPTFPELMRRASSFVTLRDDGELRGCCGSIDASRPLGEDVWRNAFASAFSDPRFPRLTSAQWPSIDVQISVLSEPELLLVRDEPDLLSQLQPFVDGLILELGSARATFLPGVWEQLPDAESFVRHLKVKAGWHADFWSPQLRVLRYTTESFGED